jgi:hypothetical protein
MTSKQRFRAALERRAVDRLPATTHHLMPYFLEKYMNGISNDQFFESLGLDLIRWIMAYRPDAAGGDFFDPTHAPGQYEARRVVSGQWRIVQELLPDPQYATVRYSFVTPQKTLTTVLQSNEYTTWVSERLVKEKADIDIIARYAPVALCDVDEINRVAAEYGDRGLIRGHIATFDVYGQPGCWQDASVLYGIEALIMATYEDPDWVRQFMEVLRDRKLAYIRSLTGAQYDLLELGGGDASTTVISPKIFSRFVAPYDTALINAAHEAGQRIVYHTCGGMMPILEQIAATGTDAMETFTPSAMGGDINLREAKRRIGNKVCMIGGFDQFHFFQGCTEEETRAQVRACFEAAGEGGGYILCPSDHFFDAEVSLLRAFADEARNCVYR